MIFLLCAILSIGSVKLDVEIANTDKKRSTGLMFRENLSDNQGMLFAYEKEDILYFWMKNTYIPLTIGFFDTEQKLIQILDMDPSNLPKPHVYVSNKPAKFALEVNRDWFKMNKISVGDKFTLSIE